MSHHHEHGASNYYGRAFAIGISLNIVYIVFEVGFGFASDSMALLADAGHNLSDVFSLLLAWLAISLGKKAATSNFTYGYRRLSIMVALTNAVILLLSAGAIAWEAIGRFGQTIAVQGATVGIVAGIGILINGITAALFMGESKDANIKGAFLHMAADALISLGVLVAGCAIYLTKRDWIDPLVSLVIVVFIIYSTWGLFWYVFKLSLDAVPKEIDIERLKHYLRELEGVVTFHDLHVWALSTTEVALTAHLIVKKMPEDNAMSLKLRQSLHELFDIDHVTIQIEREDDDVLCLQRC